MYMYTASACEWLGVCVKIPIKGAKQESLTFFNVVNVATENHKNGLKF